MMPIVLKTQFAVYFIKCCLLFSDGAGTKHKTPQHVRDRGRKGKGRTLNHVKLELKKIKRFIHCYEFTNTNCYRRGYILLVSSLSLKNKDCP